MIDLSVLVFSMFLFLINEAPCAQSMRKGLVKAHGLVMNVHFILTQCTQRI